MKRVRFSHRALAFLFTSTIAVLTGATGGLLGDCGPFTDVAFDSFCPFVLEIFYLNITTGTTPTTYDPASAVSRLQMAAFLSRTVDRTLQRGNHRAALRRFWTPGSVLSLGVTTVGGSPYFSESDGTDVWVGNLASDSVWRVRGSDGKLLDTWTGANGASGVLPAAGRIFVAGNITPGRLYRLDPSQPAGVVTTVASNLGGFSYGIAYDGVRIWTANSAGSVSIVTPGATLPWTATTVTTGFGNPQGILFDGSNMWVTDAGPTLGTLLKLDANGAILQTVTVGDTPIIPAFDGNNIWVPNANSTSVSVVRASTGTVLATLTGNGLDGPQSVAFDGQRILVTNAGNVVTLWKAADFTPLGSLLTGASTAPFGACSDGVNFWVALSAAGKIAKF